MLRSFDLKTPRVRFERTTCRLEGGCSIQLSYRDSSAESSGCGGSASNTFYPHRPSSIDTSVASTIPSPLRSAAQLDAALQRPQAPNEDREVAGTDRAVAVEVFGAQLRQQALEPH